MNRIGISIRGNFMFSCIGLESKKFHAIVHHFYLHAFRVSNGHFCPAGSVGGEGWEGVGVGGLGGDEEGVVVELVVVSAITVGDGVAAGAGPRDLAGPQRPDLRTGPELAADRRRWPP